jgi:NAD(P)-dependent dehydrogenase (short-subunit alcohol dehydrogenase family)
MGKITFVPVGGLANRMRAVASAVTLAAKSDSDLSIVWFQDWALNAPFSQLFKPVDRKIACLRDASQLDYALLDRPRSRNFHFPLLFQKLFFKSCLYERSITPLCNRHFDFERWVKEGSCVYMASYTAFQPYDYVWISRLFVPVEEVMEEVENRCRNFSDTMIGMHIRRTDNLASIRQSPIELFYQKLDEEIKEDDKVAIYLATDSEEVKREMKERYGDRIFCSGKKADALKKVFLQTHRIDYIINTAGVLNKEPLMSSDYQTIYNAVSTNYMGTINVAMEAYAYLKESKGKLVFFTSSSYTRGRAFYSIYSSTKAAIVNFVQAIAQEWEPFGIAVNCINPERTKTPMRVKNFGTEPENTLLSAEKVAIATIQSLVSEFTGQVIDVKRNEV